LSSTNPILIVKLGSTYPAISHRYGDFDNMVIKNLGDIPTIVVSPIEGEKLPEPGKFAGIVLTGSHDMVTDNKDWSKRTETWIQSVVKSRIPLLGICYGHQLIAQAMGGVVGDNPLGREFGTVEIELTKNLKNNILFKILPEKFLAHVSHKQSVLKLPVKAELFASSKREPCQAFFIAPCTWGVQFHPEFNLPVISEYIKRSAELLKSEGQNPDEILKGIKPTPESEKILRKFSEMIN